MNDMEMNLRIAEVICNTYSWDGQEFKEGDFISLLDGRIVAVAENADEAIA